jgi:hypothetical protein
VIDSVVADGDRTLNVYLKERQRKTPRTLTAPMFAVAKWTAGSRWPLGTGPYRVVERQTVGPGTVQPSFNKDGSVIRFIEKRRRDARDVLDGGADMMIAADPGVIDYAAGSEEHVAVELPWDRTYVLLAPTRVMALRGKQKLDSWKRLKDLTREMATDAVRADARGHVSPSWWSNLGICGEWSAPSYRRPDSASIARRILYDSSDPTARDLAERIVALASAGPQASRNAAALAAVVPDLDERISAVGVAGKQLDSSMRLGGDVAYIISLPHRTPLPCYEAGELMARAPWLSMMRNDLYEAIVPLVDARRHAIVKKSGFGLITDWYGNVVVTNETLQEEQLP